MDKRTGVVGNKRSRPVEDEQVIALHSDVQNAAETARRLGIGHTTVLRILARHHVKRIPLEEQWRRKRLFAEGRAALIRREYEEGATFADLVGRHGGTEYSIKMAIKNAGGQLEPVCPPLSEEEKHRILEMASNGTAQVAISLQLNRSLSTVSRFLKAQGWIYERACGPRHGQWKGGRVKASGYWKIKVGADDPAFGSMCDCNGYVPEHRLVMAKRLGRVLSRSETVHHINGDKLDNSPDNLQLRQGKHGKHVVLCCRDCGSQNIGPAPIAEPSR